MINHVQLVSDADNEISQWSVQVHPELFDCEANSRIKSYDGPGEPNMEDASPPAPPRFDNIQLTHSRPFCDPSYKP